MWKIYIPIFNVKDLYTNSKNTCYKFEPQNDKALCSVHVNYCNHEETDGRMFITYR